MTALPVRPRLRARLASPRWSAVAASYQASRLRSDLPDRQWFAEEQHHHQLLARYPRLSHPIMALHFCGQEQQ